MHQLQPFSFADISIIIHQDHCKMIHWQLPMLKRKKQLQVLIHWKKLKQSGFIKLTVSSIKNMKTKILFFAILTWILCIKDVSGKSTNSIKDSLLIEQYTGFYLDHVQQCWDIVEARDTTILNKIKIISGLHDALNKSQIEKGISNRLVITFRDSLTDQKKSTNKQTKRKIIWRKVAVVAIVIVVGETFYIYLKQTYDVTF